MKNTVRYIFFCLSCCLSLPTFAQQFSILNYTVTDGLPSNQINTTCEDSNGFLWIGTSNGVSRFNGKNFVNYGYTEGLQDLFVKAIFEDSRHRLWIGTLRGIYELKGNRFIMNHAKDNAEFIVWGFDEMNGHEIWATTPKGMYRFADSVWIPVNMNTEYGISNYIPGTQVIAAAGGMYINDGDKVVLQKKDSTIVLGKSPLGNDYNYFLNLLQFNNRIFISTRNCLYEVVHQQLKVLIDSLPSGRGFTYYIDKENNFWLLVESKGLYCYQLLPGQGKKISFVYKLYNAQGYTFADVNHNLWVATYSGLLRIQPKIFSEIYVGKEIFFISAAGNNQLLIFGAGGPQFFNSGHITNLQLPACYRDLNSYSQDVVEGNDRDSKNNRWIITRTWKLLRWNGLRLQDFSPLVPAQHKAYMYNIAVDRVTGRVFLCGDSTVIAGNEKHFGTYRDKNGLVFSKPTSVLFTSSGIGIVNVYLKGVYFITKKNEIIKAPAELDIIEKGNYTYFFEDRQGSIWVSNAGKGLIKFTISDDYKVKDVLQFNTRDGLPDNKITGMTFDTKKNAWITTNKEVAILQMADRDLKSLDVHKIGWKQGIVNESLYGGIVTSDDSGNVWIPGADRVIQFNCNRLRFTKAAPRIVIEKIMLNIKETDWTNYKDSLFSYLQIPYNLSLDYSQNSIGIQFMGTSLTDASRLEYSYRLEPLDTGWSAPSPNNVVSILKLSPEKYNFFVKARSGNSAWSKPVSYSFIIRPPFWETWWFRLFTVLLASSIIIAAFRYRIQQVKNQAALKNKLQLLETKALKAQMNPHFIYNALNSIQSLIINNQLQSAGSYISKFARLLRQILENADNNLIALDKELYSLQLYISLEELRLNFELKYKEEIDDSLDAENERIPSLILQPFVENALWHGLSKKEGKKMLILKIKAEGEWIVCEITDNGIGRNKAGEQYHIFPEGHLSKASSITSQRLINFNQSTTVQPISFIDHTNADGQATGTTAIIKIRRTKFF